MPCGTSAGCMGKPQPTNSAPSPLYEFTPRRTRDGPERFLAGFQGYLQADAFAGYDRICAGANVIRVACWAHAGRKFDEARTTAPLLSHLALARVQQLYRIEKACVNLSAEYRRVIRQRHAVPLLNSFGEWLDEQGRKVLPKSPIGKAVSYARAQWEDLQTYIRDGELSIDNNVSERSLRPRAIGRKNYMFVGSDRGVAGRRRPCTAWWGAASVFTSIRSPTSRTSWSVCPRIPSIGLANSCPMPGSR